MQANLNTQIKQKYASTYLNIGRDVSKQDKKDVLAQFCQFLNPNLSYRQSNLFPDKMVGNLNNISDTKKLDLLNHLKKCHMAINNNRNTQNTEFDDMYIYLHKETCVILRGIGGLNKSPDEIKTAADQFLFLIAHRDGHLHHGYASRIEILKDFLQNELQHTQNLVGKISKRGNHLNYTNISFQDDKTRLGGNGRCFEFDGYSHIIYNSNTVDDIENQACKPNSSIKSERDPFVWFKSTSTFNQKYFDENNVIPKVGKLILYVAPNEINEYVIKIKTGIVEGKLKLVKLNIINQLGGGIYQDKHPEHTGTHGIEFYVEDCTDVQEIMGLHESLVELNIITGENIFVKPDIFTRYEINEYLINYSDIENDSGINLQELIKNKLQNNWGNIQPIGGGVVNAIRAVFNLEE